MKSTTVFFLIQIVVFFNLNCQNSNKSSAQSVEFDSLKIIEKTIKIDTLVTEKYFWQSFIYAKDKLYFIKENNNLYEYDFVKGKYIGAIPSDYMCETFSVTKDFLAFDVELEEGRAIFLYCLNNFSKWGLLKNYHIINQLCDENIIVLAKPIDTPRDQDSVIFYDIKNKKVTFKTEKFDYTIVGDNAIFLYNRELRTKNSINIFEITKIDRKNFTKTSFDLKINKDIELVYIYDNQYLAKEKNNLIMYNFDGSKIASCDILSENYCDILCLKDEILIYDWNNMDDENLDKYYFLCKTIDLKK